MTDAINTFPSVLLLETSDSGFAAKQLAPQDLSVLTVLSTAAAQQEDLFDCLASFGKPTQSKTEQLHMACKDAVSAFKLQESPRTQNIEEYLHAATAVAKALQAALGSGSVSSCNRYVIQGKDVAAHVTSGRRRTNSLRICMS